MKNRARLGDGLAAGSARILALAKHLDSWRITSTTRKACGVLFPHYELI
jgi:hypothetical protein